LPPQAFSTPRAPYLCPGKRPEPVSAVFGYHQVIHVRVIAAAAPQYAAIAFFVVPGTRG